MSCIWCPLRAWPTLPSPESSLSRPPPPPSAPCPARSHLLVILLLLLLQRPVLSPSSVVPPAPAQPREPARTGQTLARWHKRPTLRKAPHKPDLRDKACICHTSRCCLHCRRPSAAATTTTTTRSLTISCARCRLVSLASPRLPPPLPPPTCALPPPAPIVPASPRLSLPALN